MGSLLEVVLELVFFAIQVAAESKSGDQSSTGERKDRDPGHDARPRAHYSEPLELCAQKPEPEQLGVDRSQPIGQRREALPDGLVEAASPDGQPRASQSRTQATDCPECRAYNPPDSAFCGECGARLGG
jgi:hypothetical protein